MNGYKKIKGQYMNRSTFQAIKYELVCFFFLGSVYKWLGFEIMARTPVPQLPSPPPRILLFTGKICILQEIPALSNTMFSLWD